MADERYHVWLARQQMKRLEELRAANPDMEEMALRQKFFGTRYEAQIATSIVRDIVAWADYDTTKIPE